jgi:hypothetical protein
MLVNEMGILLRIGGTILVDEIQILNRSGSNRESLRGEGVHIPAEDIH